MKTLTTNRTRNFCRTNVYFRQYVELYERKRSNKYMNKYDLDYTTYFKNELYHYAWSEFKHYFGLKKDWYHSIRGTAQIEINSKYEFAFYDWSCRMENDGEWYIYITDSGCIDYIGQRGYKTRGLLYAPENEYERGFKYNGKLDEQNISKSVIKFVEKNYLYPEGRFRRLQYWLSCDKSWAKTMFKEFNQRDKKEIESEYINVDDKKLYQWVKKNFNIEANEYINPFDLIRFVNKRGRFESLVYLTTFDFDYDGDGDIDELESDFYDYMDSFPKNTVFL